MDKAAFDTLGWAKLPYDPDLKEWAKHAYPQAIKAAHDPVHHVEWLRSQGTWFVGVDVLTDYKPLSGTALEAAEYTMGEKPFDWGAAQVSVCYKGYPKHGVDETAGMFNYRKNHDFAHLDGLKAVGDTRRRMMDEFHGFILGIPLNETPAKAAPFVIWEGSHLIFRDMLTKAYAGIALENWQHTDITDIYQATRAEIFKTCKRVELHVKPGEATIAHRFSLHGMAGWDETVDGPDEGRIIAYFRPYMDHDLQGWLRGQYSSSLGA